MALNNGGSCTAATGPWATRTYLLAARWMPLSAIGQAITTLRARHTEDTTLKTRPNSLASTIASLMTHIGLEENCRCWPLETKFARVPRVRELV